MDTKAQPAPKEAFIRVREVLSSTAWGGWIKECMPLRLRQRFFMVFWPEARLRRHLEMLKAFGFNSIQTSDNPCCAWWVGMDERELHDRRIAMCRAARKLGMSVSLAVWGASVADRAKDGQQFSELDWHRPADRARLETWYRESAELAPYADRVITHWIDPGVPRCPHCTIDTVVEMHNVIMGICRQRNPKIRGALSTWFMRPGLWPGYKDPGTLAAHPALDRNTDIVLGLMNCGSDGVNQDWAGELKASDLDAIAAAGRQTGVWGWYTADMECHPALHVRTDILQNYFRGLPPRTRTLLAWHSIDDTFPGLNMQNLYVAGKLMQDPSLDARRLLDEFVTGFVGAANAPAVAAALRAIELARTRSWYEGPYDAIREAGDPLGAPETPDRRNRRPLPDTWLEDSTAAVADAQRALRSVRLNPKFTPAWPVTMEPAVYLPELKAHLEATRQMLVFLKGVREVERLRASGATPRKLKAAVNALPRVKYDRAHTAGLEAEEYGKKLAALRKSVTEEK